MKKNLYILILTVITATACKKADYHSTPNKENSKYDCVCTIVTSYVDHCGTDTTSEMSTIYSSERNEAESACKKQNTSSSSVYSITTKSCELK